jgi:hypothetical protein
MFWVDDDRDSRKAKIKSFLKRDDMAIAVLLATANLEWTVRRAILRLGMSTNKAIREGVLYKPSSLQSYKDAWKTEVKPRLKTSLPNVIRNWSGPKGIQGAYTLRHKLIHGEQGSTGLEYARTRVNALLSASDDVDCFCMSHGCDIFKKLPIRRKARTGDQK